MSAILKGTVLISPAGTRWTLVKRWTRGWGGQVWYKFRSDRGAFRNMLTYEFAEWKKEDQS